MTIGMQSWPAATATEKRRRRGAHDGFEECSFDGAPASFEPIHHDFGLRDPVASLVIRENTGHRPHGEPLNSCSRKDK